MRVPSVVNIALVALAGACGFDGRDIAGSADAPHAGSDAALDHDGPLAGSDAPAAGSDAPGTTCTPATHHDEDGDGVADDCDPCPQVMGEAPTDDDGDGIPNACDPRPNIAGDHLVKFFSFDPAAGDLAALGWTGTLTPWMHVGDDIAIDQDTGTQIIDYNAGIANVSVDIGFDVEAHSNVAGARHQQFFDVLINASTANDSYVAGGFYYDGSGNGRELFDYDATRNTNNGFLPLAESPAAPPTVGQTYRMRMLSTMAEPYYRSTTGGGGEVALSMTDARRANQHVGLRTQNASTVIHYIAIYGY